MQSGGSACGMREVMGMQSGVSTCALLERMRRRKRIVDCRGCRVVVYLVDCEKE
jgi:hypothetical protein